MSTQLAVRDEVNVNDLRQTAQLLALSGYFEAKGNGEQAVAQLATKILAGREMGFGPYASVNGIHIIQGKPTVSANLMAAAVKASARYDYRVRKMDDSAVSVEFLERTAKGLESLGVSTFTREDAQKAGTQNMAKFGRNMMFARAMSNGVRWYCPDVFMAGAVYTPEELGAEVNDAGDYVESTARTVDKATGEITEPRATGKAATAEVQFTDAAPSETLLKTLHATGIELYGATWDDKRHELVRKITKGRTASSKELTDSEAVRLLEGMQRKLQENAQMQPAMLDTAPVGGAAYN